ncbi:DUF2625 family protein [Actinomyces wuliandei]|uniref:DUF2625 family protein n=1 Tax=Actinomyces wuliandei TaxID=2057743 RepID=UPI000FDB3F83|nr:DUF2625 family protein [Actinomyces wuliandei]
MSRSSDVPVGGSSVWEDVTSAVDASPAHLAILPSTTKRGRDIAARLGLTESSTLGALLHHCGGILVDHGRLRILAAGSGSLPDVLTASRSRRGALVVGHDAFGGRFAIDAGGLGVGHGQVCHFGPDTLHWRGTGMSHGAFVRWAIDGGSESFYSSWRWRGWEQEIGALRLNQALSTQPPLFSREGRNISLTRRKPVPFDELVAFLEESARLRAGG